MDAVFQVMSEINSRNNFIRQISVSDLLNWVNSLSEHGSSFASKYSVLTNSSSAGSCWMIRWIVSLATHRCCSLVQVFANIFLPLLKKCISSTEIQVSFGELVVKWI